MGPVLPGENGIEVNLYDCTADLHESLQQYVVPAPKRLTMCAQAINKAQEREGHGGYDNSRGENSRARAQLRRAERGNFSDS